MIKTALSTFIGGTGIWTDGSVQIGSSYRSLNQLIKSIFASGEQGVAYDPNDLSTMWQDASGTIPVTAAGQPVGLMLDKSKGLVSSQNMMPQSSFSEGTTGWVLQSGWTKSDNKVSNTSGTTALESPLALEVGKLYRVTLNTRRTSESGTLLSIRSGVSVDTQMVLASVNGIQTFLLRPTISTNTLRFQSFQWLGDIYSVQVVEILGNHAYQSVSASRPILQRNATTSAYYLEFDGVDDFLQTNTIDFTATDKVSLFAGVNAPPGAATGCVIEIGTNATVNNGSFGLFKGPSTIQWASRGTTSVLGAQYNTPVYPDVLCAKAAINISLLTVRRNAILSIDDKRTQGTGNYGNYPLYIGRRGGTSLPFIGHLYGLIGIGRLTTDSETIALEKSIAKNVGVTLNV